MQIRSSMPRGMLIFTQLALLSMLAGCSPTPERAVATRTAIPSPALPKLVTADSELERAFRDHRSDVWVEGAGTVTRILRDDTKRPRHQRFVVQVENADFTVLIAHNIDLAPRVPFRKGDRVAFRGEYEWNAQGGVVHWTHRDPKGGKDSGGWIRWRDFVYR
jgi:Protein of unknown function (DUF3465)